MKDFEAKLEAELRRGVLQIAVLALAREPAYGYQLLKDLASRGIETEEGTLYPILRRLETRGLVESSWRTEGPRPRKYYQTTSAGRTTLGSLFEAWHGIRKALEDIEDGTGEHEILIHRGEKALDRFLDEVTAHTGAVRGRKDFLRELESAVLDRAEEQSGGALDRNAVEAAIRAVGDPASVAAAFTGEKYLIGPRLYRPFIFYTAIVFVVHMVMILVASVALTQIRLFPVSILRVEPPYTILGVLVATVHALLMDIGLMVIIFAGFSRVRRTVRLPQLALRVHVRPRQAISRIVLTLLVAIILNLFRDRVFVVLAPAPDGAGTTVAHPIFSDHFVARLPWITVFLALLLVREILYVILRERKPTVAADAVVCILGAGLMIWLLAGPALLSFPAQATPATGALPTLNSLAGKALDLILIAFAVGLAVNAARRVFRITQL